ncbi:hypothetical protein SNEBB_011422 [Seison nebaliae]|nr:hypothetical protein SNEBB_011422 [Seison nebaliae]
MRQEPFQRLDREFLHQNGFCNKISTESSVIGRTPKSQLCRLSIYLMSSNNIFINLQIYVKDINDNSPNFSLFHEKIQIQSKEVKVLRLAINENTPIDEMILLPRATDIDTFPIDIKYVLIQNQFETILSSSFGASSKRCHSNTNYFQLINSTTPKLRVNRLIDHEIIHRCQLKESNNLKSILKIKFTETPLFLLLRAIDPQNELFYDEILLKILINDENDNFPKLVDSNKNYEIRVKENIKPGTELLRLQVVDDDTDDQLIYRIRHISTIPETDNFDQFNRYQSVDSILQVDVTNPNERQPDSAPFELSKNHGILRLAPETDTQLDREYIRQYNLTVEISDLSSHQIETIIRINVIGINDNQPKLNYLSPSTNGLGMNKEKIPSFKLDEFEKKIEKFLWKKRYGESVGNVSKRDNGTSNNDQLLTLFSATDADVGEHHTKSLKIEVSSPFFYVLESNTNIGQESEMPFTQFYGLYVKNDLDREQLALKSDQSIKLRINGKDEDFVSDPLYFIVSVNDVNDNYPNIFRWKKMKQLNDVTNDIRIIRLPIIDLKKEGFDRRQHEIDDLIIFDEDINENSDLYVRMEKSSCEDESIRFLVTSINVEEQHYIRKNLGLSVDQQFRRIILRLRRRPLKRNFDPLKNWCSTTLTVCDKNRSKHLCSHLIYLFTDSSETDEFLTNFFRHIISNQNQTFDDQVNYFHLMELRRHLDNSTMNIPAIFRMNDENLMKIHQTSAIGRLKGSVAKISVFLLATLIPIIFIVTTAVVIVVSLVIVRKKHKTIDKKEGKFDKNQMNGKKKSKKRKSEYRFQKSFLILSNLNRQIEKKKNDEIFSMHNDSKCPSPKNSNEFGSTSSSNISSHISPSVEKKSENDFPNFSPRVFTFKRPQHQQQVLEQPKRSSDCTTIQHYLTKNRTSILEVNDTDTTYESRQAQQTQAFNYHEKKLSNSDSSTQNTDMDKSQIYSIENSNQYLPNKFNSQQYSESEQQRYSGHSYNVPQLTLMGRRRLNGDFTIQGRPQFFNDQTNDDRLSEESCYGSGDGVMNGEMSYSIDNHYNNDAIRHHQQQQHQENLTVESAEKYLSEISQVSRSNITNIVNERQRNIFTENNNNNNNNNNTTNTNNNSSNQIQRFEDTIGDERDSRGLFILPKHSSYV